MTVEDLLQQAELQKEKAGGVDPVKILICCVCLGDRSDAHNEIVECDGCGVTVHEGCYGVSETDSVSSTVSSCSTMPWFCEACRAGVDTPECELCPNSGGIFKETDTGKWVHLVCALYIPGVAFGEVDKLSCVTLFEMAYSKWGARACSLCVDQRFARTGVCVGCDAGMCRTYFHVTCGQREGLLSEAHSEEVDQADPFYAHCKHRLLIPQLLLTMNIPHKPNTTCETAYSFQDKMASIPQLESCCCGCSLKTGSKVIGWLHLVGSIIATVIMGTGLAAIFYIVDHPEIVTPEAKEIRANFPVLRTLAIILIMLYLASCALAFVLLLGVYQNKAKLVIIWVAAALTMAVMEALFEILQMIYTYKPNQLLGIVTFAINLYLILVVYSFYRTIRNVSSNYA